MRIKYTGLLLILLFQSTTICQVFDGITQPTDWRFWTPLNYNIRTKVLNASPFVGYKIWIDDPSKSHFSTTIIFQYNFAKEIPSLQSWNNLNLINRQLWLMSRTGYNFENGKTWETLSGTLLLPLNFNIDFTWYDFSYYENGRLNFLENDRLQIVGSYKMVYKTYEGTTRTIFVFNFGKRVRGQTTGLICNLRLYIQNINWLQFRYDFKDKIFTMSTILQFNNQ